MTIIEKIKAEIERRKMESILFRNNEKREDWASFFNGEATALENLLSFISTLESEKPMNLEELEKAIGSYMSNKWKFGCINPITPVVLPNFTTEDLKECARHFAQWGAEHLKK